MHYTIGSAGAALDDATLYSEPWRVDFFDLDFGYLRVNATRETAVLDYVRNDRGDVRYRLEMTKN